MRRRAAVLVIGAFGFVAACGGEDAGTTQRDVAGDTAAASRPDSPPSHDTHAGTGEAEDLLPIMQKLGMEMAALTHGIMTEDTALVARSAESIAHHAPIAQGEIERIHTELGAEMEEFERLDVEVHEASVRLYETAEGDAVEMEAVLSRLNEVQRGCVQCHTLFRERLRTNTAQ